jgi:hypothetical protein
MMQVLFLEDLNEDLEPNNGKDDLPPLRRPKLLRPPPLWAQECMRKNAIRTKTIKCFLFILRQLKDYPGIRFS